MFTENLDDFLDVGDFAEAATYTPDGGAAVSINGIFDLTYVDIETGGGVPISGLKAVFTCKASDVAAEPEGDTVTARGVNYTIMVHQPDGTGLTLLVLEKV